MEEITTVIKGTELKVLFTATIDGDTINYLTTPFKILYYTTDKSKALVCSSEEKENILNYIIKDKEGIFIRIPTEELDAGALKCEATLYVVDEDFDDDPTKKDDSYENELEPDYYKIMMHALGNITGPSTTFNGIYVKEWIKDIKVGDILICYNNSGDRYSITSSGMTYLVKLEVAEIIENKALVKIMDNNNNYIFGPDVVEASWVSTSYIKEPTSYDGYRKEIQRETTKIKIIE